MAFALLGAPSARGQTPNIVVDIRVEGVVQVEMGLILSNLASKIGDPVDRQRVTEDIKTIYGFAYFSDVQAYAEEVPGQGIRLIFVVVEKPRIAFLRLHGNTLLSKTELGRAMSVKVGNVYRPSEVEKMLEQLRQEYRDEGYFSVVVSYQAEQISEREIGVSVLIEETPRVYVTNIRTRNNVVFTELEIQRMIQTSEVDCFDWINDSGVLDELKINQDLQVVSAAYLRNGYIRLFIDKPLVRVIHNPEFSRVEVLMDIAEGDQYFTGTVDIAGDILGDKERLLSALRLAEGEVYNPFDQNQDVFSLNEIYQEQGYAFVRVIADRKINDDTKIVDVVYRIVKGEKAYIGRIEIQGNAETRDFVIRREFEVRENELYNGRKLRESQNNLRRLGYFQPSLQMDTEPTEVGNVLDVVTKVEETQTGTFQAQLGFSEQTKLSLALSLSKGNLFGRGQTLRLRAATGQRGIRQNYSVDFIEPHLLDTDISSDTSFAFRRLDDLTEQNRGAFEELRLSQGFGFPVFRIFRITFTLEGINRTFERSSVNTEKIRSFTTAFSYSTVNHPIFPTDGTEVVLSVSQIGGLVLDGTTEYRRYRVRYRRFMALNETSTMVLMGRARVSWLEQVGDNEIPSQDRFRLGGITTLRGYDFLDVGGPFGRLERELNEIRVPLLDDNGDPILDSNGIPVDTFIDQRTIELNDKELDELRGGGIFERLFNLELLFPLAGDNVRGVIFYDAGEVNAERRQYELLREKEPEFFDLRQSVGVGVRLISPLGVFRFEYGTKLTRESGETPDKFDFTISTLF
ncbi:MAG: outer membrane protein assembly factor BamA [SAR324 cluster bacterium]|nr:outer membrane protein assembly factor BamA [SAR324 cluster bacterium]